MDTILFCQFNLGRQQSLQHIQVETSIKDQQECEHTQTHTKYTHPHWHTL